MLRPTLVGFLPLFCFIFIEFSPTNGFDSMDPNGNITVRWDVVELRKDGYTAMVTIFNNQLYRHIETPGWRLGWTWPGNEVIWTMWGAEATQRGNCSRFKDGVLPHCCKKKPVIIDLLPNAPYNQQEKNCCRGGVISSLTQNPATRAASFKLAVGDVISGDSLSPPVNFSLGLSGYSCGDTARVPPTAFSEDGGRRTTHAFTTWQVTCAYSQPRAYPGPTCCVSLSAFYNSTIVPCPRCSCGCQRPHSKCVKPDEPPPLIQMPHDDHEAVDPLVLCTRHMCPIRVHWHVKVSYREYWRVKMTVTNFNYVKNYSEWNLVVQHPNLDSVVHVFSFNYKALQQYGSINDTGMFWGIQYYNDMLLQSGDSGNVQTEFLLRKDPGKFTFSNGWAFPRKISFNGDECVMPPPESYPTLPNNSPLRDLSKSRISIYFSFLLFTLSLSI